MSFLKLHLNFVDQLDPLRQSKMSVDHLKSGGVQTESMQMDSGWMILKYIALVVCYVESIWSPYTHLESIWSPTGVCGGV